LASADVFFFEPTANRWLRCASMNTRTYDHSATVCNGKVFVAGGYGREKVLQCYDPQSDTWTNKRPMPNPRICHGMAAVGRFVYVFGGISSGYLKSVDQYDTKLDKWKSVSPMRIQRAFLGAAMLGGCIYVVGGMSLYKVVSSMERYDPEHDAWEAMPSMRIGRRYVAAATLDGFIYVAGGKNDRATSLSYVERFDVKTQSWRTVADMQTPRDAFTLVTCNAELYAIAGYNYQSSNHFIASVERYDPVRDVWEYVAKLPKAVNGLAGVCVEYNC